MLTRFFITALAYITTLTASKTANAVQNTQNNLGEALASKMDVNTAGNIANTEAVANAEAMANAEAVANAEIITNTPGVTDLGLGVAENIAGATPPETIFSWGNYFQAIALMGLLLGLLWLGLHLLRRSGKFSFLQNNAILSRNALSIESQITLAPKKSLVMVRFLNNHILLGVTEHNITFLKEVPIHDDERIQENPLSTPDNQDNARTKTFERALHHANYDENTHDTNTQKS